MSVQKETMSSKVTGRTRVTAREVEYSLVTHGRRYMFPITVHLNILFSTARLTDEDCKGAILQHVNENCCYGTKPAKEMTITKTEGITALHVSCYKQIKSMALYFQFF